MYTSPTNISLLFNDTATTEIYTLSLHDALPILQQNPTDVVRALSGIQAGGERRTSEALNLALRQLPANPTGPRVDRKSTRLNSSHANISYAVFCLKQKNQ